MALKNNTGSKHGPGTGRTQTLEQRVGMLEKTLANSGPVKDWRRTIGMFGDDPVMKEIFDEALRIREKDREMARRKYARRPAKS
jgi:hypothetical protein